MPKKSKQTHGDPQATLVDRLLHALNHPIRRRILTTLVLENGSAKTLSDAFDEPLGVVSYHLNKVLDRECDVVELVDRVQKRGATEKFYTLKEQSIVGVLSWPGIPNSIRRSLRDMSLKEFLAVTIAAIEAGSVDSLQGSALEWFPVQVDWQSWLEIRAATKQFDERVKRAVDKSRARRRRGSAGLHNIVVGIAAFEAAGPPPSLRLTPRKEAP